jgi:hypothetical protein
MDTLSDLQVIDTWVQSNDIHLGNYILMKLKYFKGRNDSKVIS